MTFAGRFRRDKAREERALGLIRDKPHDLRQDAAEPRRMPFRQFEEHPLRIHAKMGTVIAEPVIPGIFPL
jgi:hypothetical protein